MVSSQVVSVLEQTIDIRLGNAIELDPTYYTVAVGRVNKLHRKQQDGLDVAT